MMNSHINARELILHLLSDIPGDDENDRRFRFSMFIHANAMHSLNLISENNTEEDIGLVIESIVDTELDPSEKTLAHKIIEEKMNNYENLFFTALELLIDVKKSENKIVVI